MNLKMLNKAYFKYLSFSDSFQRCVGDVFRKVIIQKKLKLIFIRDPIESNKTKNILPNICQILPICKDILRICIACYYHKVFIVNKQSKQYSKEANKHEVSYNICDLLALLHNHVSKRNVLW